MAEGISTGSSRAPMRSAASKFLSDSRSDLDALPILRGGICFFSDPVFPVSRWKSLFSGIRSTKSTEHIEVGIGNGVRAGVRFPQAFLWFCSVIPTLMYSVPLVELVVLCQESSCPVPGPTRPVH